MVDRIDHQWHRGCGRVVDMLDWVIERARSHGWVTSIAHGTIDGVGEHQ